MDDGLAPAALAPLLWARGEGNPKSTESKGLKCHKTLGDLHISDEDFQAMGAERGAGV